MNLIERLRARRESFYSEATRASEWRTEPLCAEAIAEIERLTAQVEVMREVEKEIILRLQWAHCTTYHKDMEALFREILAAENPLQHLKELTFAFTALSYRGGD